MTFNELADWVLQEGDPDDPQRGYPVSQLGKADRYRLTTGGIPVASVVGKKGPVSGKSPKPIHHTNGTVSYPPGWFDNPKNRGSAGDFIPQWVQDRYLGSPWTAAADGASIVPLARGVNWGAKGLWHGGKALGAKIFGTGVKQGIKSKGGREAVKKTTKEFIHRQTPDRFNQKALRPFAWRAANNPVVRAGINHPGKLAATAVLGDVGFDYAGGYDATGLGDVRAKLTLPQDVVIDAGLAGIVKVADAYRDSKTRSAMANPVSTPSRTSIMSPVDPMAQGPSLLTQSFEVRAKEFFQGPHSGYMHTNLVVVAQVESGKGTPQQIAHVEVLRKAAQGNGVEAAMALTALEAGKMAAKQQATEQQPRVPETIGAPQE